MEDDLNDMKVKVRAPKPEPPMVRAAPPPVDKSKDDSVMIEHINSLQSQITELDTEQKDGIIQMQAQVDT